MRKENWFLAVLCAAVLLLFFFVPSLGWDVHAFLSPSKTPQSADYRNIKLENESLRAELAQLRGIKNFPQLRPGDLVPAFVYSRYPFNFKNELLVNAGRNQGVISGQAAVVFSSGSSVSNPIFVGKVETVFENVSVVETVFDARFRSAVRIGNAGTNALLQGGSEPKLVLMPKDAKIADGDPAYSVNPGVPYGLAIGAAKNIRLSPDQLFQEADVETDYNSNDLQSLFIVRNDYTGR